ncbi:hypothetical protein Tsp_12378, partial [Trichinella spiralis]
CIDLLLYFEKNCNY